MKPKVNKSDLLYPELSYEIVGALFDVSNNLGGHQLEKHYQKSLAIELRRRGVHIQEQVRVPLTYRNEPIGSYYADFIVDDKILLEIKKNKAFTPKNIEQVLAYLRAYNLKLGILANFTDNGVRFKRIVNIQDS